MRALMLATVWLALSGFVAGEAGKARYFRTGVAPRWAWSAWCAGLVACLCHIVIAMSRHYRWSHEAAVLETARQTAAFYGLAWGGGIYVNYLFVGVWLAELLWWRLEPGQYATQPPWMRWAVRTFYLVIVFNAAVVFAAPGRRAAGAVVVAALLLAWLQQVRRLGDLTGVQKVRRSF
jgi:hypothetical protein